MFKGEAYRPCRLRYNRSRLRFSKIVLFKKIVNGYLILFYSWHWDLFTFLLFFG
ncbi:MAG: hypothetical protein LBH59_06630 [Planctomycetaceae bacterium]|nr:hypothetical protein [Planctomycetaceae bacterium]